MRWLLASLMVIWAFSICLSQRGDGGEPLPVNLIFSVEGLHCENCVANLTKALKGINGVKEAEVSLKEKRAFVTLDESQISLSKLLAKTHEQVRYRLALLLPIENWDKVDRNKVVKVVKGLRGVSEVKADKAGLLVSFNPKEDVKYSNLSETLKKAGFKVLSSSVKFNGHDQGGSQSSHEHSSSHQSSCCSECPSAQSGSSSGSHHSGCH